MRARTSSAEADSRAIGTAHAPRSNLGTAAAGRWRLVELLGRGGSAEVWLAVDDSGREAALKLLRAELRAQSAAHDLIRREFDTLERVAHPHVVHALGVFEHAGADALALEFLPGGDLVSLLGEHPRSWLDAVRAVLEAMLHLHAHGIAHCDLKARHVLFAADGSVRIVDFSAARALDDVLRRGATTRAYEPATPTRTARDSDCFAFAALLYELVAGRLPYGTQGPTSMGQRPTRGVAPDAVVGSLVAVAVAALEAGGQLKEGLSTFTDVIESASRDYGLAPAARGNRLATT